MQVFESGEVQDMCGEDVSFCLDAKEAGFEIWCDPRIRVGHEDKGYLMSKKKKDTRFTTWVKYYTRTTRERIF